MRMHAADMQHDADEQAGTDGLEGSISGYDGYWPWASGSEPESPSLSGCVIWAGKAYVPLEPRTALDTFKVIWF